LVRVHGTRKALAITTDCTPRYCAADPFEGGKQAVAEVYRNLSAVGATPLAITNCLNFGNPQRPEIMAQFVGCVEGMAEACAKLDFPVVSGNVSLYNESKATGGGSAILPTPAIGGVGLLADYALRMGLAASDGQEIVLLGDPMRSLGQSLWLREIHGREEGLPPRVFLEEEAKHGTFVRKLIGEEMVKAVHDVSDGGVLVALAEMALAGGIGIELLGENDTDFCFGESQGLYLLAVDGHGASVRVRDLATAEGITSAVIAHTGGDAIGGREWSVKLADLRAAHEGFFKEWMES